MLFIPCPTPSQRGLVTSQPQSLIPHLDGPKWWRILHPILQHQILQTLMHSTDIPVPRSNRNNLGVTNEKFDISSISIPSNQHRGCEPCLYCLCTPYTKASAVLPLPHFGHQYGQQLFPNLAVIPTYPYNKCPIPISQYNRQHVTQHIDQAVSSDDNRVFVKVSSCPRISLQGEYI